MTNIWVYIVLKNMQVLNKHYFIIYFICHTWIKNYTTMTLNIGMTGSRTGMSDAQKETWKTIVDNYNSEWKTFHHGDCVGADETCHKSISEPNYDVCLHIHPPSNDTHQAHCEFNTRSYDVVHTPKAYLKRNHDIVNAVKIMYAFPNGLETDMHFSGTWATIRYTKKQGGKKLYIILPDGEIEKYTMTKV